MTYTNQLIRDIKNASHTTLTNTTLTELVDYIQIYVQNRFSKYWMVNNYISNHDLWDQFTSIRSINTHQNGYVCQGIRPIYFAIVCNVLNKARLGGSPLEKAKRY